MLNITAVHVALFSSVLWREGAASEAGVLCCSRNSSRHHPSIQSLQVWLHRVCATRPFYTARQGERSIKPSYHQIMIWYDMLQMISTLCKLSHLIIADRLWWWLYKPFRWQHVFMSAVFSYLWILRSDIWSFWVYYQPHIVLTSFLLSKLKLYLCLAVECRWPSSWMIPTLLWPSLN